MNTTDLSMKQLVEVADKLSDVIAEATVKVCMIADEYNIDRNLCYKLFSDTVENAIGKVSFSEMKLPETENGEA